MDIKKKNNILIEKISVLVLIILYVIASSLVSLNRHWQFNSFWYDFGIFDTSIWKLSRFQLPIIAQLNPPIGKIVWADHFNPSLVLLAPFYWLTSRSEMIFIAQALFVGLSALIGYIIALKFVHNMFVRFALIISYLGFVGLQNALYTDVHNIVFALLPLMLTIWATYLKKWKLYWIFLLITLGIQENMTPIAIMLGLYLLLRQERVIKIGLLTMCIGFIYGLLVIYVLIPCLKGGVYTYQPTIPLVWCEWFTRFLYPLDLKLRSIILTFASFGFLPIGSFAVFPLIIEHYLERFVLNQAATRWDLGFHYNAILSPIMFLGSLEVIIYLQKKSLFQRILPIWAFVNVLIVIYLHRFLLHGPLMLATHPIFYKQTKDAKFLVNFKNKIPISNLLMTQNNIAAQFTHNEVVLLNYNYPEFKPDTIVLDLRPGQNANNFWPLNEEGVKLLIDKLMTADKYIDINNDPDKYIFIRKG